MIEETLLVLFVITASPCLSALMYTEQHVCSSAYIYGMALCHDDVTPMRICRSDNIKA